MIFNRTKDEKLVRSVLFDDSLLETTLEDLNTFLDVNKDCYLSCIKDNEVIGVAVFKAESSIVVEYHPNLLKRHRKGNSDEFTKGALNWLYDNAPMYNKVNVKFPSVYKHIKLYAERLGFTFEGLDRESCKKGDRLCYGITRKEIGELICQ